MDGAYKHTTMERRALKQVVKANSLKAAQKIVREALARKWKIESSDCCWSPDYQPDIQKPRWNPDIPDGLDLPRNQLHAFEMQGLDTFNVMGVEDKQNQTVKSSASSSEEEDRTFLWYLRVALRLLRTK